ncbi:MAG: RbsD/FucU domain-containing protein [Deltaproteobacteria bacterium]
MLRGLDPILSPDLLYMLRAMGHGDTIAIVDGNFPGLTMAQRLVRLDAHPATLVVEAVLRVMPLDDFVPDPAQVMEVVGDKSARPAIIDEYQDIINRVADNKAAVKPVERFAFYDLCRAAHGIVQTGEARLYGNIILKKGVIRPAN